MIHTSMGQIQLELYPEKAPVSVENFINYANERVLRRHDFSPRDQQLHDPGRRVYPGYAEKELPANPIRNEANNGLSNRRGTIAMARTNDPHSATSQFFINVQDNMNLDYQRDERLGLRGVRTGHRRHGCGG